VGESSAAVRAYILGLVAVSALVVGLCLSYGAVPPLGARPVLAVVLAAAATLAQFFPIHLADKTKVYVDAAVFTAAVLLLPPLAAVLVAASAIGVRHAARRDGWDQAAFNVAQTATYVGVGGLVFRGLGPLALPPAVPGLGSGVGIVAAAVAMHLINTLAVAGVVGLQVGEAPLAVWHENLWLDFPEHLVLVGMGVVLAALAGDRPWLLPLVVPPVALVYASLRRGAELRLAADAAAVATGDLLDLMSEAPRGHSRRVAAWTSRLADQLGVSAEETAAAVRAAHLHGIAFLAGRQMPAGDGSRDRDACSGVADRDVGKFERAQSRNALVALHVAERRDGLSPSRALVGDAIPVGARLVAVADAFDRLVADDVSGCVLDPHRALGILRNGAGGAWDPRVVAALCVIVEEPPA
jgi:HD-GYP domain-containing protein (c-di-GMP phosphodiesterase class II)